MKFLGEKENRRFFLFLACVFLVQIGLLGFCGFLQVRKIQKILADKELAAVSYLLEQNIPPELVAAAWNQREATEEGRKLLELTGHTKESPGYLLLLLEEAFPPFFLMPLSVSAVFAALILAGTCFYFRRRERLYEEAEQVIDQYAKNRFGAHLPSGQEGTIYQLFDSVEQLSQSLQAKSQMEYDAKLFLRDMISNISHQLKTPLAALSMYTEIMLEESEKVVVVREFSRKSLRSLERMEQLIQSLLTMARLDTGAIVFEKQQCLAGELVEQALGDLTERAFREGKKLFLEGQREETLTCDLEWTKEAVANLVKNALDHTEAGDWIRVCWVRTPAVFRLRVEDQGCGIGEEDIHHIFKQFYRSRASCTNPGVGLGLSLAKAIVEGQGGSLSVESRPGEGCTFFITFLTNV